MKKQPGKEAAGNHVYFQELREESSVENSKRRHMLSLMGGNFKFFERILTIRKIQEPRFVSRASTRNH